MFTRSGGPNGEPSLTFRTVYLAEMFACKLLPPLQPPDPRSLVHYHHPPTPLLEFRIPFEARGKRKMDLNENSGKDRAH